VVASWQSAFQQLRNFISANPVIEINQSSVYLPGEVRPDFYQLFDCVRACFIKEKFPSELAKSEELSRQWHDLEKSVTETSGFENVEVPENVSRYLAGPLDGLMRGLFDPLFDVLKGRIDASGFESQCEQVIARDFEALFHDGYKYWVCLALIKLLDVDELFTVPAKDYQQEAAIIENDPSQYSREEELPDAELTKRLVFEHSYMHSFLTPRVIVRSRALGRLVALRTDFYRARWTARKVSGRQEWLSIHDIEKEFGRVDLWPELFIYLGDDLEDLFLVSDYRRIARPDVCLDFKDGEGWYCSEAIERVRRHYEVLNPRLGSFLISRCPVPEAVAAATAQPAGIKAPSDSNGTQEPDIAPQGKESVNISVLNADFNTEALIPIIETLKKAKPF
jgi:hypothetical protein